MKEEDQSFQIFLVKVVEKLKREAPRRFKDLRASCDRYVEGISNRKEERYHLEVSDFEPILLSCESRYPRLIEISLESIHYMIEHNYFSNKYALMKDREIQDKQLVMNLAVEIVCKCSDDLDENVQLHVIKTLLIAMTSSQFEVHETCLLIAIRACFQINLTSKSSVIKTTARAALTQIINIVFQRMEAFDTHELSNDILSGTEDSLSLDANQDQVHSIDNSGEIMSSEGFASIYQKDAYLIFRALCKLSTKGVSDDTHVTSDSVIHQNKILSLELINGLLRQTGPIFRTSPRFINGIKSFLCVSLLSNCTSNVAQVAGLALQIFVFLIQNFKEQLKTEIEVFISTIFLRIIESEYSTFDHKSKVLEVIHLICADPSAQTDVFVNYDCDLEATNLFAQIVQSLAKIAKNPSSTNGKMPVEFISSSSKKAYGEDYNLRSMGLEGLVIMLRSLLSSCTQKSVEDFGKSTKDFDPSSKTCMDLSPIQIDSSHSVIYEDEKKIQQDDVIEQVENQSSPDEETLLNVVEAFDKKQRMYREIQSGILKFNLSPMKGLKYLASNDIISLNPRAVANFLHNYTDRLDKTAIGDLLGREREYESGFCYEVLHEYVDSMDFSNLEFDSAIRLFLSGFRLPGEAQKIDRIMEKFAEKYYVQHKDEFASADMAFILAFSTIMLQTNLHNPAIREDKRMTKEQFIKQNKGISSDGDLSDELLGNIYERIASEPISLQSDSIKKSKKDESAGSFVMFSTVADKKRKDAFNNERKEMVRVGEAMIRQGKARGSVYVKSQNRNDELYVRSMYDIVWPPVLGAVSQILETEEDSKLVELSVAAFELSISLSCRLDIPVARNTFINALTKFTTLDTVKEMRPKHIMCIKLLLQVTSTLGDSLEESWNQVLISISQLVRLQFFVNGSNSDHLVLIDSSASSDYGKIKKGQKLSSDKLSYSDPLTKFFMGPSKAETAKIIEENNAEVLAQNIDPVAVDRIFLNSTNLSGSSILHFVRSLCSVSLLEITNSNKGTTDFTSPRTFCLQKLVEVADYNMSSRARLDWANIWSLLARHFENVGLSENEALAMYAIDSLKQLSIKFLQKEELSNFNFQRLFLKPFEIILAKTSLPAIKDLILRCIDILIRVCAVNIRSGWRTIFNILEISAYQDKVDVPKIAFDILHRLMNENFSLIMYDFVELMNCLVAFVGCPHTSLSLQAIGFLSNCANHLSNGTILSTFQHTASDYMDLSWESKRTHTIRSQLGNDDEAVFRLWWPLLLGLSTRVADGRPVVRTYALDTLRGILFQYGSIFSAQTWSVIFKGVLFPIMDSAKIDNNQSISYGKSKIFALDKKAWIQTMAYNVLSFCSELYFRHREHEKTISFLPDLLSMLEGCIMQKSNDLVSIALDVLHHLITNVGFTVASVECKFLYSMHSDLICKRLTSMLYQCLHVDLLRRESLENEPYCSSNIIDGMFSQEISDDIEMLASSIQTEYGKGVVVKEISPDSSLKTRYVVKLDWGVLYTCQPPPVQKMQDPFKSQADFDSRLEIISCSLLFETNTACQIIELLQEAFIMHFSSWQVHHYREFFHCFERIYWYSYLFNKNLAMRIRLKCAGFFGQNPNSRFPHILKLEVDSLQSLLQWSFFVYFDRSIVPSDIDSSTFSICMPSSYSDRLELVACILQRLITHLFMSFVRLINELSNDLSDEDEGFGNVNTEDDAQVRFNAYTTPVKFCLTQILAFSAEQFDLNAIWLTDLLCQLISCDDRDIRLLLLKIYIKHINHRVLRSM